MRLNVVYRPATVARKREKAEFGEKIVRDVNSAGLYPPPKNPPHE